MSNYYVAGLTIPEDSATASSSYGSPVDTKSPDRPEYIGGLSFLGHRRDPTASTVSPAYKSEEPLGVGVEPLNIIILGTSFAGLSCAHHFLDHTIDRLRTTTQASYRLIIIGPSTHLYWNIAAPHALVAPGLVQHEDTFIAVEPGFHRHRGHQFTIIQASCIEVDPEERSIKVDCYNFESMKRCAFIQPKRSSSMALRNLADLAKVQTLKYHALLICTGTSAHSDLLSLHGPHLDTAESLSRFHNRLAQATSIVVGGGGCSAVEIAGKIATYLNYTHHFPMRTKRKPQKQMTLISSSEVLLPDLPSKLQRRAEHQLLSLGVHIIHSTRIIHVEQVFNSNQEGEHTYNIILSNGTNILSDIYIPCTGVSPNTSFLPPNLLDPRGYVLTHNQTMRVERAGPRTYALGDVASYSQNYLGDVYNAVPVVMHNLEVDLMMEEHEGQMDGVEDKRYVQRVKDSVVCPISRFGGVGIWMGTTLPSMLVHLFKGRRYRTKKAERVVVEGGSPYRYGKPTQK